MRTPITLVTKPEFQIYKPLSNYAEDSAWQIPMRNVQESMLRPFLGDTIYFAIESGVYSAPIETLLETYVKPWLIFQTWAEMMKASNIFHTNSGIKKFTAEFGQQPEAKLLELQARDAQTDALRYYTSMERFLKDNQTDYPDWPGHSVCAPKSKPLGSNFGKIAPPKPSHRDFTLPLT